MSASTQILADIQTVITSGPSTLTKAACIAAAGPILDYQGNSKLALLRFQEADLLLNAVEGVTDPTDDTANLALIDGVIAALEGTGSPSTTLIADLNTVLTNGVSGATQANAIDPAGQIMD